MKRMSRIYRPTLVVPKDAKIIRQEPISNSQRLLVECGLVRPCTPGCYALLPLARRSMHKLESLVRRTLNSVGAQEVSLPALARVESWRRSGRFGDMKEELFCLKDRHDREYILSPTHEEMITELLAEGSPISHKHLPLLLYQITSKYRDEKRTRHGLLRAREFVMCDAYSAHTSERCSRETYAQVGHAYTELLRKLRVPYFKVLADNGAMGGSVSHEYHYASPAGEDTLDICRQCGVCRRADENKVHQCEQCGEKFTRTQSIEVAHTFILGTRYSEAFSATQTATNPPSPLHMACYGVGVSRLLAAGVEVLSTDRLRWPAALAPYTALVVGPKEGSAEYKNGGREQAEQLTLRLEAVPQLRDDVILDDRDGLTVGKRLLDADRMGYPLVIVVGRKGLELHSHTREPQTFATEEALLDCVTSHVDQLQAESCEAIEVNA